MTSERRFGEISDVSAGAIFANRAELSVAGVHRPRVAGISGSAEEGADSIVLNGGYEDDEDLGDVVIYTGHGGNDPQTKKQVANQELTAGNLALAKSCLNGFPVRVVRGWREPAGRGPTFGYRYDGLYRVVSYWAETGRSGYRIWRFRLERIVGDSLPDGPQPTTETEPAPRQATSIQRIIRNTAAAQRVKEMHGYRCQVCGEQLLTPAGPYVEGAHVRPLGRPHDGPDDPANIICLCPNHHVLFDAGALVVTDDLTVYDRVNGINIGALRTIAGHQVSSQHFAYHRRLFSGDWRAEYVRMEHGR
jgi:putative restriction endonuclease